MNPSYGGYSSPYATSPYPSYSYPQVVPQQAPLPPPPQHHYSQQPPYRPSSSSTSHTSDLLNPSCAVCSSPPSKECTCELSSLVTLVSTSESRILHPLIDDIRHWVTARARASIDADFRARSNWRRAAFEEYTSSRRLGEWEYDELRWQLKRDVDADWREAVARYPEVLDHYYGVVEGAIRSGEGVESVLYGNGGGGSSRRVRERSSVRGGRERSRGRSYVIYQ